MVIGVEVEGSCPFHIGPLPECGVQVQDVPGDESEEDEVSGGLYQDTQGT